MCIAGCVSPVPAHGTPDAGKRSAPRRRARLPDADASGLEVSPRDFLQDQIVQRLISHEAFQTRVLLLQLLEPTNLVDLHAAVFLAPAVVGLFADAELTGGLGDRFAL